MKKTVIRLICLILTLVPLTATAQSNIKSAFDAIINCPAVDLTTSHFLGKDPKTNVKNGQDYVYDFVLPANKMNLIKKALAAFDKDIPQAYAVKSGKNTGGSPLIYLHSEQSGTYGIDIDNPGYNYIYALFLPSKTEDPDGKYRYSYAMNYKEENGQIRGKLVINYATSQMYREGQMPGNTFQWKNGSTTNIDRNGTVVIMRPTETEQQTWFEMIMACVNGIDASNSEKTNRALATKAYTLIRDVKSYPEVTDQDKATLRQIFKTLRSDKRNYDPILLELLHQCETAIK